MNVEPLIYTTLGNVPESSLDYKTVWEDNPDYTKLTETHRLKTTGEIVKQSVHVYGRKTLDIIGEQAQF